MPVAVQSSKTLTVLLVSCTFIYAGGVYLTRAFLCQPVGVWFLLAGVVVGAVACAALAFSAFQLRSVWRTIVTVALVLVLAVMFFFIGVLALPGCFGV